MLEFLSGFRIPVLLLSIAMCAISAALLFWAHRFWPWGWAIGAVSFFFCFKSDTEKKGYRF
ncbi:MAG TPA: hypothetical protein VM008_18390 [Phycisphaerae bacterium]|nr:hypothetical protein [Phycisphaerae bacterium]